MPYTIERLETLIAQDTLARTEVHARDPSARWLPQAPVSAPVWRTVTPLICQPPPPGTIS